MKKTVSTKKMTNLTTKTITKKVDNKSVLVFAKKLAIEAGALLVKRSKKISSLKIKEKKDQGLASNADVESEELIISTINKKYPTHFVLAEESAYNIYQGEKSRFEFLKEKEWVWIIDPLDGTNNFLSGLDYYAVCISLVHFGKPVVGVVYRPVNGDMFTAIHTAGAFFENRQKKIRSKSLVQAKNTKSLKASLLVTGFTTEKGEIFDQEFELFKSVMGKSRGIRRMGSAALDLCYVSLGIFDCFWERGLAPWDVSASGLICLESKVLVSDYDGLAFHPFQETILAARAPLYEEALKIFSKSL